MKTLTEPSLFAPIVQDYFCQRLINQRNASHQTITSYRDAFRLLLTFAEQQSSKEPAQLTLFDLDG
jgi:integrase/recombinase XerD